MTKRNHSEDNGCTRTIRAENTVALLIDHYQRLKLDPRFLRESETIIEHLHGIQTQIDKIEDKRKGTIQ